MTTQTTAKPQTSTGHFTVLLLSSVFLTLILFYIDEGYYNFNWTSKPGNWVPFAVYVAALYFSQFLVSEFLLKKQKGLKKTVLSVVGGGLTLATVVLIIAMFTSW